MTTRSKMLIGFGSAVVFGWFSLKIYSYFWDTGAPRVEVSGLKNGGYYAGDMQCGFSSTKKGDLSVMLDGKPLLSHFRVSSKGQEYPFAIATRTIANGEHTLHLDFCDSSYHKNKVSQDYTFLVDNVPLQAAFVRTEADYKVFQGRTLHVQFQVNKEIKEAKVRVLSHAYSCFAESAGSSIYEAFIPVSCDENPNEYLLAVDIADHVGNTLTLDNKFQVVMYPFKKQSLHVSAQKVKEEHELGNPSAKREQVLAELASKSPQEKLWRGVFCTPIDATQITCDFGVIRTTQEKGRYQHKALDLISSPRSVVWAPQAGIVVLKDRFEDSGNTVVVDHGLGILSLFYHLEDFAHIEVGQKVAQGNPLGLLGKTGYATGYHLHWEMRINNCAVDPMQWTKATF